MSLFTKNKLFTVLPATLLSCTLAVSMTGCNQSPTASTSSAKDSLVVTNIALDTLNNVFFTPLINSDSLNDEQKACLEARDQDLGRAELQRFYKENFSNTELKELEDFYTSDVGKKMLAYGNQQALIINGDQVLNPIPVPTEEEQAKVREFMQSPLAMKYMQVTSAEGKGSTMGALTYPMNKEFERCHIDLDMSEFV